MFVWAKINSNKSSKELTDYLLYEKNIFVAPGFIFGKNGEGYIRFSLCLDEQLIIKAKKRWPSMKIGIIGLGLIQLFIWIFNFIS